MNPKNPSMPHSLHHLPDLFVLFSSVTKHVRRLSLYFIMMLGLTMLSQMARADYIIMDDQFDDNVFGTNPNGIGNGFTTSASAPIPTGKICVETNGTAYLTGAGNGIARY